MKKMFLGGLLFIGGLVGVVTLMCMSILNPATSDGIGGFIGFLGYFDMTIFFIFFVAFVVSGLVICVRDAYPKK